MNKEKIMEQLRSIAEEAKGSSDPEVRATAGILYSLLGAMAIEQTFQFMEISANFSKEMVARITTAKLIQSATKH